jgi:hypothetical protein
VNTRGGCRQPWLCPPRALPVRGAIRRSDRPPHTPKEISIATTDQQITAPFAELDATGESYDLSIWLTVNLDRYPQDLAGDVPPTVSRDYCIEANRTAGTWSLRVSPWSESLESGDDVRTGPPLVERRDQTAVTDPLTVLRALVSGQTG